MKCLYKKIVLAATILSLVSSSVLADVELNIDLSKSHQTIDAFGASDAWAINPTINKWVTEGKEDSVESLADMLFSVETGIGLSAWRFNVGAGSDEQGSESQINDIWRRAELMQSSPGGPIDTTKQLGQIRFMQEAHERGVKDLIAFSNSPPVWATRNGLAHASDDNNSTNLADDMVDEFATFLVDVVEYMRNIAGVPINYISPINEPTWHWSSNGQEGSPYNIEDMKDVYSALYNELETAGLNGKVAIEAGETVEHTAALSDEYYKEFTNGTSAYSGGMNSTGNGDYKNYIDQLLGDVDIKDKIGNKISLHGYFSDASSTRLGPLRDLVLENVRSVSSNAKIWMSEVSILGGTGDIRDFEGNGWDVNDMEYAVHVGRMLHRDLTRLNVSAWHWWLGVTPYNYKDGLVKVNSSLAAESVQDTKVLWTVGNYSRFIRPGYKRVDLPSVDNLKGLMASAYKSNDDTKLVIVAVNGGETSEKLEFNFSSLPDGKSIQTFKVYLTNKDNDLADKGIINLSAGYNLAATSVVTFVADIVDNDLPPVAGFGQSKQIVGVGDDVEFNSYMTNSPDTFSWTFSGGSPETSASANENITYNTAGSYAVTLTSSNQFGTDTITVDNAVSVIEESTCDVDGGLNLEKWVDLTSTSRDLSEVPFDQDADEESIITSFEISTDVADNYATRIRGYVCAPATGDYTFWIASDNHGELWLSIDETPEKIIKVAGAYDWTNPQEWEKFATQKSGPIYLIAGQKYYVETIHREVDGGDNLAVGWQLPDQTLERPIASNRLSLFMAEDVSVTPPPAPIPTTPPVVNPPAESGGGTILYLLLIAGLCWFRQYK